MNTQRERERERHKHTHTHTHTHNTHNKHIAHTVVSMHTVLHASTECNDVDILHIIVPSS